MANLNVKVLELKDRKLHCLNRRRNAFFESIKKGKGYRSHGSDWLDKAVSV